MNLSTKTIEELLKSNGWNYYEGGAYMNRIDSIPRILN